MAFSDQELGMLREAAQRLVRDATATGIPAGRDMASNVWDAGVESGWTALLVPEAEGGIGAGLAELCVLAEELGAELQAGSFISGHTLAGQFLVAAPAGSRRSARIEQHLAGSRTLAVADLEPAARGAPSKVSMRARSTAAGWQLDGAKSCVLCDAATQSLLVTAIADGPIDDVLLFDVSLPSAGLELREYATVDGGRAVDLRFDAVRLEPDALLAGAGSGFARLRLRAWDIALIASAAECVGMMASLLRRTSEYLGQRRQFGQPLAKMQVLRHRLADMALARLRAEALIAFAVRNFSTLRDIQRARLAAATASKALSGARFVAEQAVQLHGGMGVSEDLPIGRFLRRVIALEATLGNPDHHRGRFDQLSV